MSKKVLKKAKLCTVILEYQNPQLTLETINSLRQAKLPSNIKHKIVVVDNSPVPDGSLAKALKKYKNIKLITTHQNTGFAQGNNLGIQYGLEHGYDYFILLNNDVEVKLSFIKHFFKAIKAGADIVVPKIYFAKGYEFHKDRYKPSELGKVIWYAGGYFDWNNVFGKHIGVDEIDKGQYDKAKPIDFANACCIFITKQVFDTIGLLNPDYFLYFEDADFSYRAFKAGFKILYEPKSVIFHKTSASSGSGSKLHDYYLTRNRLLFGLKYAPFRTKLALIKESFKKLISGRPGEKQGVTDFCLQRFGKGNFV